MAQEIENALAHLPDIPLDWSPTAGLTGPFHICFRFNFNVIQPMPPQVTKHNVEPYWTLIFDDEDYSQAHMRMRHCDVGALAYQLRVLEMAINDTEQPDYVREKAFVALEHDEVLECDKATHYLTMVAQVKSEARDANHNAWMEIFQAGEWPMQ